jgi:threonine/homoserine/homoserine lactone efflux protein
VRAALDDLLPLAVVIAVSPVPILAIVFMLLSDDGRRNSVALLCGWVLALAVGAGTVAALGLGAGVRDDNSRGVAIAQLVLAVLLLAGAAHQWRSRAPRDPSAPPPRWMVVVETITAPRAVILGVALIALNPKDGASTLAAGASLADADLAFGPAVACLAIFVAVASLTVAGPLVVAVLMGDRAEPVLMRTRGWLERHGSTAVAIGLLVIAIILLIQGFRGL